MLAVQLRRQRHHHRGPRQGRRAASGEAAFREHHGLQCGFCTPGMIMSAVDMINRHGGELDEATVRHEPRRQHLSLHRLPQHRQARSSPPPPACACRPPPNRRRRHRRRSPHSRTIGPRRARSPAGCPAGGRGSWADWEVARGSARPKGGSARPDRRGPAGRECGLDRTDADIILNRGGPRHSALRLDRNRKNSTFLEVLN